jgi:hypothetical protein
MVSVGVSIGDDDANAVARRLLGTATDLDPKAAKAALASFAQLAVSEHIDWLLGRTRYRSLSELQIERIGAIFAEVMSTEIPTATRLYNDLGLSHGQAVYVARVLADRQLSTWRERARAALVEQVSAKLDQAKKNVNEGRAEADVQLNLSKLATRELESTFEQAFRGDPSINPPKRQTSVGDLNFMGVESGTVLALAKVLGLLGD